jgi:uncharacterized protein YqjF (DUF2071 family)
MSAVSASAERRPTNDLASTKASGRDSIEPGGNDASVWNFVTPDTSELARRRLLSIRGEPLFYANWDNVTFIHYQTDPDELQRCIPYQLDLYDGNAFVSLVAFTMRGMRPRFGGSLSALCFKPISTYHFLNVRTYVAHEAEPGIYFMQEWLSNRLATWLGPCSFGLPYRFARMDYPRNREQKRPGKIEASAGSFHFCATLPPNDPRICAPGSLDEFLLERYTAFTQLGKCRRFFRIWHEPWRQVSAEIQIASDHLIHSTGQWWLGARRVGANYSSGVNVLMGWPHVIGDSAPVCSTGHESIL